MNDNNDIRVVIRTPEFDAYYGAQSIKVQEKYDYVLQLMIKQYVISEKFIKKIETTDLYEMRVSLGNNEHRTLLYAIDNDNFMQSTQVILLNSFLKKETKQYRREVSKAIQLLKQYRQ